MSQKSGVLVLKSELGSGQILFCEGLIHAARLMGAEAQGRDLRGLLVEQGILDSAEFDVYAALASELGLSFEETLGRETELDSERVVGLLHECIESAVIEMFSWSNGDFSFEAGSQNESDAPEPILEAGLNAQYLAMEGMRVLDEKARAGESNAGHPVPPIGAQADDPASDPLAGLESAEQETAADILVSSLLENDAESPEEVQVESEQQVASLASRKTAHPGTLILMDPDIVVLEWVKNALRDNFKRVHTFQRTEQGLARIRQYLIRGELPIVLISLDAVVDPLSGIHGLADFVQRLKAQAARLRVLGLIEEGHEPRPALSNSFDDLLARPLRRDLSRGPTPEDDPTARSLSETLARLLSGPDSEAESTGAG
jgi:hypothetical protein